DPIRAARRRDTRRDSIRQRLELLRRLSRQPQLSQPQISTGTQHLKRVAGGASLGRRELLAGQRDSGQRVLIPNVGLGPRLGRLDDSQQVRPVRVSAGPQLKQPRRGSPHSQTLTLRDPVTQLRHLVGGLAVRPPQLVHVSQSSGKRQRRRPRDRQISHLIRTAYYVLRNKFSRQVSVEQHLFLFLSRHRRLSEDQLLLLLICHRRLRRRRR